MITTPKSLCVTALLIAARLASAQSQNPFSFTSVNVTEERAIRLAWQSESNTIYQVQYADQLADPDLGYPIWHTLYDLYPSHGTNTFWLDTGNYILENAILHPKRTTNRFYRILSEGTNSGAAPSITITSPTNGAIVSDMLTVSVNASTAYPIITTKLYVDGEEMYPSDDGTNYIINTCEWPNGPHTLFATAEAHSDFSGPDGPRAIDIGRAVSAYVPLTFSNLITKVAFTQPFFEPSLGQTQVVTAAFAANVNWTLQIQNEDTNTMRFASGSGTSMLFAWDGTGTNGATIPDGLYTYFISAQTNGQSFSAESAGDSAALSLQEAASSLSITDLPENWYPRTKAEALAAGWTSYFLDFPPLPPYRSNGVWVVRDPHPPLEIRIPQRLQGASSRSLSAQISSESGGYELDAFSGGASQSTTTPTRPQTAPVKEKRGDYSVFYYSHSHTNIWPVPFWQAAGGTHMRIHISGSLNNVEFDPVPEALNQAGHFAQTMHQLGWKIAYDRHDEDLHVSSLRRADLGIGGSELATYATIGLFIDHGTFGDDQDFAPGSSGSKLTYWPSGNASDSGSPWLRMCQFGFGGNLKWMAILACNSLCDPNYGTMTSHGAIPLKETHLVCGTTTIAAIGENIGSYWARNMIKQKQMIRNAWFNAGRQEYTGATNLTGTTITFRVSSYPECIDDTIAANTSPTSPSPAPGSLIKRDSQVFP